MVNMRLLFLGTLVALCSVSFATASADLPLVGEWFMLPPNEDSVVELFASNVALYITQSAPAGDVRIAQRYGSSTDDTIWLNFTVPATSGQGYDSCHFNQTVGTTVFAENAFAGVRYVPGATLDACNVGAVAVGAMTVQITGDVHASTGAVSVVRQLTFAPQAGGMKLNVCEQRSSRQGILCWTYAPKSTSDDDDDEEEEEMGKIAIEQDTDISTEAEDSRDTSTTTTSGKKYYMTLDNDWTLSGTAPEKIMLISLQAMANWDEPTLYFDYGPDWDFTYCKAIGDYYVSSRSFDFQTLNTTEDAIQALAVPSIVSKYVVYDPSVRESILVAMTLAGVYRALVVSPDLISKLPAGMTMAYDLRGKFTGFTPAQTYEWAYDNFAKSTSRDTVIWLGGECGDIMKPGVADYGIRMNAFFTDLNTRPLDDPHSTPAEYKLADRIMGAQNKYSMVQGWHSYCKDMERTFVTMSSSHALRVEGLHTIPNLSFNRLVNVTKGFEFKNHHHDNKGKYPDPEKGKVYVSCVQTDALGLGAWVHPGRGAIPYAWETTLNFLWLQPAVLEFYYTTATPNDYFIGALSGPGYMYPKAIPSADLPGMLDIANGFVDKLDIRVFETMDYSQGSTVRGNTDLTSEVVDVYYDNMTQIMGFINGYSPSFTFDNRKGRPFVSFDYYLAPPPADTHGGGGSTDEALTDLLELGELNSGHGRTPYFLLMHVREWSNITRVQHLLERLPDNFETVPLDTFLAMAGKDPTFEPHFAPNVAPNHNVE